MLKTTFDGCIVLAEDLSRLSSDLLKFVAEFGSNGTGHASAIARDLVEVGALGKRGVVGVCFRWTSVTDCWVVYDDEVDEDFRLYDVSKDNEHWFLYQKSDKTAA